MAALRRGVTTIRFWVSLAFLVILFLLVYYVASDRMTPMTRDAYIQAFVIPVAPLVSGEVTDVFVKNGSPVKKGDPLFRIDPRPFQFDVDRLHARLDQLQSEHGQADESPDSRNAAIRQVRAELAKAELSLAHTTALASDDGIVDNMQLHAGAYAQSGKAVMTLVDSSSWWIVANYEENALSVIREGQAVEFGLYMFPGRIFAGQVESIGWGVERGQGFATGNLPHIDNPSRWIAFSQRFQVRIAPTGPIARQPLRVGATARVVVFTDDGGLMNALARLLMRVSATTDYLY